ncbi:ABC transporter ATP-binding protein [Romboutsia weinsteinii]|uniref:ABC transporter ATP-binding protein n=1 Tax=Romboutsia weinsteinii TaxID=2020949 RepID=A0A371J4H2_9FIRM|nr:ABC transporter ATP-binding protein [Romboutsia weinsteinii]RDY27584.1 ABC transporter ATP-binding protein [Romboutsia weinsteinii]
MIKLDNIEVKFGDFLALSDINLEIKEGEFFTFLGPSGCGKTTTLRTIVGFIQPTDGKVYANEVDITNTPVEKRNIGLVFQSYALFPTLNVYENIAFGLKVNKMPKNEIDEKVRAIAQKVDLSEEQLMKKVSELSGGQQQRIAIARALVMQPEILCLDEPLSNLDAKLRVQLRNELKELQQKFGITTIYVTHDQEEALTLSDRIAVFNKGVIEQIGTPREIYNESKTEFVCNFIGDINKIDEESIKKINAQTDYNLDENKQSYIRLERIGINEQLPGIKYAKLKAEVVSFEYYGLYIKYYLKVGNIILKSIEKEFGQTTYQVGEIVEICLNPMDIMQY